MQIDGNESETSNAETLPPRTGPPEETIEYEPPAIVFRAPLEVTAAFCDPMAFGKTTGYCMGPTNS